MLLPAPFLAGEERSFLLLARAMARYALSRRGREKLPEDPAPRPRLFLALYLGRIFNSRHGSPPIFSRIDSPPRESLSESLLAREKYSAMQCRIKSRPTLGGMLIPRDSPSPL